MPKTKKSAEEAAVAVKSGEHGDVQHDEQQGRTSASAEGAHPDSNRADAKPAELSYEKAFGQLEQILVQLEGDDLALDQSLALYEQGVALVGRCSQLLDSATLRVQQWQENGTTVSFTGWQEG